MTTIRRSLVFLAALALTGLAFAPAAQAAVPDRWAFAFMNNPTPPPGFLMDLTRQWKSDNVPNSTVSPLAVGRYQVKFPNIASSNGVAHVTAVAGDARWCQVRSVFPSGADEIVEVQCYKYTGAITPDWSQFTVMYSTSSGAPTTSGAYAYVQGKAMGGTATSYNSSGGANTVTWGGPGTGTYKVFLTGVSTGLSDGNIQATAQNSASPRRCKVDLWNPTSTGQDIVVRCYNQVGAPADTDFNLTYHRKRAVYGALMPPKYFAYLWTPGWPGGPSNYNSVGAANSVVVSGVGQRFVTFNSVGLGEGHVQVTAYKGAANYCNLQNVWGISGTNVLVRNVICWNSVGAQADTDFFITYSSRA